MWQTIAYAGAAVLAVGLFIWYKFKTVGAAESEAQLRDAQIERDAKAQAVLQKQLSDKAKQESEKLKNEVDKILVNKDQAAALELLAKLRHTH